MRPFGKRKQQEKTTESNGARAVFMVTIPLVEGDALDITAADIEYDLRNIGWTDARVSAGIPEITRV